jgi:lipoprotein signal peptidase
MQTWKKYAIVFTLIIVLVVVLTLLAVDYNGWGTSAGSVAGPVTNGLYELGNKPISWAQTNGYTMLIFYIIGILALPLIVAYLVWHYDIGYKINGTAPTTGGSITGYTAQREPEEPETIPTKGA